MKQTRNDGFLMKWPKSDEWSVSGRHQLLVDNNASNNSPGLTKADENGWPFHTRFIEIALFLPKGEFWRPCQSL